MHERSRLATSPNQYFCITCLASMDVLLARIAALPDTKVTCAQQDLLSIIEPTPQVTAVLRSALFGITSLIGANEIGVCRSALENKVHRVYL